MTMPQRFYLLLSAIMLLLSPAFSLAKVSEPLAAATLNTYGNIVYQTYRDAYSDAMRLQETVDAFLAQPDSASLAATHTMWHADGQVFHDRIRVNIKMIAMG